MGMNFRMVLFGVQPSSRNTSHHSLRVIALESRVRHWGVKLVLRLPSMKRTTTSRVLGVAYRLFQKARRDLHRQIVPSQKLGLLSKSWLRKQPR